MSDPIVTLTTDFGAGCYVAQMKGVMLGYASRIQFVDVTHEIAPQGIRQAAIALGDVVASFPAQTIHLVVVDPGVGSLVEGMQGREIGWLVANLGKSRKIGASCEPDWVIEPAADK